MTDSHDKLEKNKKPSLLARDLDAVGALIKRSATLGAVLGFLHHLTHFATYFTHC